MINKRFFTSLLLLAGISGIVCSQIIKDSTNIKFNFDIEAQVLLQPVFKFQPSALLSGINDYKVFDAISDNVTDNWGNLVSPKYEQVTDNPLFHGAFYARIKSETVIKKNYSLKLDLVVEDRGMSYGINDMNKIVVFPIYQFDFHNKYKLWNDSIHVLFQVGCFMNNKYHYGVKLYNIDTQGIRLKLDWNNFSFLFSNVADLSFGVGLELEELSDISLSYKAKLGDEKYFDFGINYALNSYPPTAEVLDIYEVYKYNTYGVFVDFVNSDKANYYLQYEMRNAPYVNIKENSAFVVGANINLNYPKLSINLNPEFRYYGWMYNYGHKNDSVSYRNTDKLTGTTDSISANSLYSNTVGRYLYPLMNFNNQFSQWAVYTDYQYQNIAGLELRANIQWNFFKKFSTNIDFESCTLLKEYESNGKNTFTYLFYTAGIIYKPVKYFSISLELGNKAMNLDKHFQTFYMSKQPLIGFRIRKELTNLR